MRVIWLILQNYTLNLAGKLKQEDKLNKPSFTQVDSLWINDTNLSDGAFKTLVVLKSFDYGTNKIFPSIKTIAQKRGKTITCINNHLKELRKKSYISTQRRGYSESNLYTILKQNHFVENETKQNKNTPINNNFYHQKTKKVEPNNITNNTNLNINKEKMNTEQWEESKEKLFNKFKWLKGGKYG